MTKKNKSIMLIDCCNSGLDEPLKSFFISKHYKILSNDVMSAANIIYIFDSEKANTLSNKFIGRIKALSESNPNIISIIKGDLTIPTALKNAIGKYPAVFTSLNPDDLCEELYSLMTPQNLKTNEPIKDKNEFEIKLKSALKKIVNGQRNEPLYAWQLELISEEKPLFFYFYSPSILSEHYTNIPALGLGFDMNETPLDKLWESSIESYLNQDETSLPSVCYCANCGDEIDTAANIICGMINEVYELSEFPIIEVIKGDSMSFIKSSDTYKNDQPVSFEFQLTEDSNISDLLKNVEKYNQDCVKKGYPIIELDTNEMRIFGILEFKSHQSKGFFKGLKSSFNDAYMAEDFHSILKMCLNILANR